MRQSKLNTHGFNKKVTFKTGKLVLVGFCTIEMAVEEDGLLLGVVSELAHENGRQLQLGAIRPRTVDKATQEIRAVLKPKYKTVMIDA